MCAPKLAFTRINVHAHMRMQTHILTNTNLLSDCVTLKNRIESNRRTNDWTNAQKCGTSKKKTTNKHMSRCMFVFSSLITHLPINKYCWSCCCYCCCFCEECKRTTSAVAAAAAGRTTRKKLFNSLVYGS